MMMMKLRQIFTLAVVFTTFSAVFGFGDREHELSLERILRALEAMEEGQREERRDIFECNKLGESCRGVVPCCGTTQCYWRDGYSALKSGECVECVAKGQKCQRDTQCCTSLVCQKGGPLHVDGYCDSKRSRGQPCHENDQCASANCNYSWKDTLYNREGSCE